MAEPKKKTNKADSGVSAEQLQAAVEKALAEQQGTATNTADDTAAAAAKAGSNVPGAVWKPSKGDKHNATWRRWVAVVLWLAAIAIELWLIFFFIKNTVPFETKDMWILIGAMAVCAALSIIGAMLWKKANRYDPPSEKHGFTFWLRSQLGAVLPILAFLPLIIVVLLSKNLDGKQKGIATAAAALFMVGASFAGADYNPVSVEQYSAETGLVSGLGQDTVYWSSSKDSKIFHICDSGAGTGDDSFSYYHWAENAKKNGFEIQSGTVKEAHLAGKERLSKRWQGEATRCGVPQDQIDAAWATSPIEEKWLEGGGKVDESETEPATN